MRLPPSLKSAHWVMWSSPVLLLVLVFTLTASSSSTPPRHLATHATSSTTTLPIATSTSTTLVPVVARPRHTTTTTEAANRVSAPPARSALTVTNVATIQPVTSAARASNSSSGTASNVKSNANASAENASNDVVSGQLSPDLAVADVPLRGPGTWTVATSGPVSVTLTCAGTTIVVQTQFEIAAHSSCQITITAPSATQNVTWELVPSN